MLSGQESRGRHASEQWVLSHLMHASSLTKPHLWMRDLMHPSRRRVSAPLWNSETSKFAGELAGSSLIPDHPTFIPSPPSSGMFTVSDIIHLIQYYYHTNTFDGAAADVEHFRLESIRGEFAITRRKIRGPSTYCRLAMTEVEQQLQVPQPPLLSVHPMRPLFEACRLLIRTHARRLPLIDQDDQTGKEVVLSVLTQYRVLKFMAVNVRITGTARQYLQYVLTDDRYSVLIPVQRNSVPLQIYSFTWDRQLCLGESSFGTGRTIQSQRPQCKPPCLTWYTCSPSLVYPLSRSSTNEEGSSTCTKRSTSS